MSDRNTHSTYLLTDTSVNHGETEVKHAKTASAWNASYNVICTVVGSGLLQLPQGVAQGGWISLALLTILCIMATYTAVILIKCAHHADTDEYSEVGAQKPPPLRTYGDIGQAAFGSAGRWFVNVQMHLTLMGVASVYLLLSGANVAQVFGLDHTIAVLICTGLVWFHVFLKTMGEIGLLSAFNVLVAVFLLVVVVIEALRNPPLVKAEHTFINIGTFPQAFSSFAFAYGVHPVLPTIYESMKKPQSYNKMIIYTFVAVLAFYLPMSIVGYGVYGNAVASPIYESLPKGLVIVKVVIVAITLHVLLSYAIVINPVERALEKVTGIDRQPPFLELLYRMGARSVLIGITTIVALKVPDFGDVLGLVSSLTSSFTVFILPCLFYMKLWHRRRLRAIGNFWYVEIAWNVVILIVAILGSVVGSYLSMKNLIKYVKEH